MELGTGLGVIRAMDADIGENAEMDYRIIGNEGPGMFDIVTNRSTQEGVIMLRKVGGAFYNLECWIYLISRAQRKCLSNASWARKRLSETYELCYRATG